VRLHEGDFDFTARILLHPSPQCLVHGSVSDDRKRVRDLAIQGLLGSDSRRKNLVDLDRHVRHVPRPIGAFFPVARALSSPHRSVFAPVQGQKGRMELGHRERFREKQRSVFEREPLAHVQVVYNPVGPSLPSFLLGTTGARPPVPILFRLGPVFECFPASDPVRQIQAKPAFGGHGAYVDEGQELIGRPLGFPSEHGVVGVVVGHQGLHLGGDSGQGCLVFDVDDGILAGRVVEDVGGANDDGDGSEIQRLKVFLRHIVHLLAVLKGQGEFYVGQAVVLVDVGLVVEAAAVGVDRDVVFLEEGDGF